MPTNEERREMARSLRELSKDTEEVSDFDLAKTLGLEAVSRCGYAPEDVLRLADLIEPEPERTCHNEAIWYGDFFCDKCGCHVYTKDDWMDDDVVTAREWSFCPVCGAKVVDDAD